jgi:hypothetical protein
MVNIIARGFARSLILGLGVMFGWSLAAEAQVTADTGTGSVTEVSIPKLVVMGQLPQAASSISATVVPTQRPANGMTDEQWANRASLGARSGSPSGVSATPGPLGNAPTHPDNPGAGVRTPGVYKSFAGLGEAGWTPSDMGLAVNDQFIMQAVNIRVTVIDKGGVIQPGFPKSFASFFGTGAGSSFTDPRMLYDWANSRWIFVALDERVAQGKGLLNLAVSQTSDPRGGWNLYTYNIDAAGVCPDFPTLGQSSSGIFVGLNSFTCDSTGLHNFVQNHVVAFPKSQAYVPGGGLQGWVQSGFNVGGTLVDTLQPVNVFDPADRPRAEIIVNSYNIMFGNGQCLTGCNGLVVWAASNMFGWMSGGPNPVFSGLVIPTAHNYYLSFGAHQPAHTFSVDAGDTRISGTAPYRAGSLWASVNTGCIPSCGAANEQTTFIWYQIDPILDDNGGGCTGAYANLCPKITGARILNEDCYFCGGRGNAGSNYYATFGADSERDVTAVYTYSDLNFNPGTAYASRRATQAVNSLHDGGIFLAQQNFFYNQGRWGDYTATAPDLSGSFGINTGDGGRKIWFSGQYIDASGSWATQIGANKFVNVGDP